MSSQPVAFFLRVSFGIFPVDLMLLLFLVPLATLLGASEPPTTKDDAILSPEGRKRFFIVHGGLFSKDQVTLEDIRKINRIGKQPGQEGIMCESSPFLWNGCCCYAPMTYLLPYLSRGIYIYKCSFERVISSKIG